MGSIVALHTGKGNYRDLVFDDSVETDRVHERSGRIRQEGLAESTSTTGRWVTPTATELVSGDDPRDPAGMVVSDNAAPRFSTDGARLFLGTAPSPPYRRTEGESADEASISRATRIAHVAVGRSNSARRRIGIATSRGGVSRRTSDSSNSRRPIYPPSIQVRTPFARLARPISKYETGRSLGHDLQRYNDVSMVDIRTGARSTVLEHYKGSMSMSPGANYVLYFDEPSGNWFTYRIADGTRTNLTAQLPVKFANQRHDTPDLAPAIGSVGWTDGDKSVLLYDEFDIWEIHPDGTGARMVTGGEGRKQNLVFRYRPMGEDTGAGGGGGRAGGGGRGGGGGNAERPIPSNKPLLLATTNESTRASGYYRVNLTGTAAPEKIMMADKNIGAPTKAKDADVTVFTEQRFDEFPDLWVSDSNFTAPKKVSNANPQQASTCGAKRRRCSTRTATARCWMRSSSSRTTSIRRRSIR